MSICLYVCMSICIYIFVYVYGCIYVYMYVCIYVYILCIYGCIYVYICLYVYVYICVYHVCIYVNMYICLYVYMSICIWATNIKEKTCCTRRMPPPNTYHRGRRSARGPQGSLGVGGSGERRGKCVSGDDTPRAHRDTSACGVGEWVGV